MKETMHLDQYQKGDFSPGTSMLIYAMWFLIGDPILRSRWLYFSPVKVLVLRFFGARIGRNVRIKPGVQVKFPWKLVIHDNVWIGENAWLDNIDFITIESNVCISQGAYLCTGNHDWSQKSFDLIYAPVKICSGAWIAARAIVGPGVEVGNSAILTMGSVAAKSLEPGFIYSGIPACRVRQRFIH